MAAAGRRRIVMMLVGDSLAGKDALLNAAIHELVTYGLADRGLRGSLPRGQRKEHAPISPKDFKGASTLPSTPRNPIRPIFLEIADGSEQYDVVWFNHGGEDFRSENDELIVPIEEIWKRCYGLAYVDVLVFVVPPVGLRALPSERLDAELDRREQRRTEETVEAVVRALRRRRRSRGDITVVVVLSKADHYAGLTGFPQRVLQPRHHSRGDLEPLDVTMYNEQKELHDFMLLYGGEKILEDARRINRRYYLVAVSGTASDESGRAASPESAPDRSLDPLLIRMMRERIGVLTAAQIAASGRK